MTKAEAIREAKAEAERFLARVKEWETQRAETRADLKKRGDSWVQNLHSSDDLIYDFGTRSSGALMRASMDLTRALARMRR